MKQLTCTKAPSIHERRSNQTRRHTVPRKATVPLAIGKVPRGHLILLVDDDSTVRDSLRDVLQTEGYVVTTAENGQQAVELAAQQPFDLVLLDLNMPVRNGWDTFEQFTREHPILPIIIITARPNQVFTAVSAGAGALLEKPMEMATLLRTMQSLLTEAPEQRLARLVGQNSEFHYQPSGPSPERRRSAPSGPLSA